MSHNFNYWTCPENVDKKAFVEDINDYVRQHTRGEGGHGLDGPIRWLNHVCDNYDNAMEYIQSHDKDNYDQLAVKYYSFPSSLYTATRRKAIDQASRLQNAPKSPSRCTNFPCKNYPLAA